MYAVIELQKLSDTQIAVPPVIQCNTMDEAESEYCRIRSIAAVSTVPVHTVLLVSDDCYYFDHKCYKHEATT